MNKAELIAKLAEELGISKAEAGRFLAAFQKAVIDEVAAGKAVKISGFAAFESVQKEARTARNPRTGEPISVPAKRVAKVRPLKEFKDAVEK